MQRKVTLLRAKLKWVGMETLSRPAGQDICAAEHFSGLVRKALPVVDDSDVAFMCKLCDLNGDGMVHVSEFDELVLRRDNSAALQRLGLRQLRVKLKVHAPTHRLRPP